MMIKRLRVTGKRIVIDDGYGSFWVTESKLARQAIEELVMNLQNCLSHTEGLDEEAKLVVTDVYDREEGEYGGVVGYIQTFRDETDAALNRRTKRIATANAQKKKHTTDVEKSERKQLTRQIKM